MIFLDNHSTGDGILSALKLLEVMLESKQPLSKLASVMDVYPQVLMNVEVDESRPDFTKNKTIAYTINKIEEKLKGKGRVLIRYSGTQPLLRVMVEGPIQNEVEAYCAQICECIEANLS
jgi:phosphoglucosamine mutase